MQVRGIPKRMARAVEAMMRRDGIGANVRRLAVLDALDADAERLPLADADGRMLKPADIALAAEKAARAVGDLCYKLQTLDAILAGIGALCARRGIAAPLGDTEAEQIKRASDPAWWRRHLGTEWKRRLEHTSIQLGLTYLRADPYVSREVAAVQAERNRANQELLERRIAINEFGQEFTVAELAAKGVANKANRRNELMTRIRGFEECADVLKHVGLFWTITCPSKFHSVGGTNGKYSGGTPRDAQAYLVHVWALIRAALHRAGIRAYGFRIAEPHTDGCPHWHMLLFVDPKRVNDMEMIVTAFAMQEDEDEAGAQANRVKLVRIEAGKGTAAGYIAKYVSKNIDGEALGGFNAYEEGTTYRIVTDTFGNMELTPSARVTYWAQVWGIRQFQQIGGAPVGVWRELRRVKDETVRTAPPEVRAAHAAAQKIESEDLNVVKRASFADYLQAQGGPEVERKNLAVKIAARRVTVEGRYATYEDRKPVGVYAAAFPLEVYEGVHYQWTVTDRAGAAAVRCTPRTRVNNCTAAWPAKPRSGPAWTRPGGEYQPGAAPEPKPAPYVRPENEGGAVGADGKPVGAPWSKAGDGARVEIFKRHTRTKDHAGEHLRYLQAKHEAQILKRMTAQ